MQQAAKVGFPLVGAIFLALAALKFVNGGNWIVWVILGVLFGGLGIFGRKGTGGDQS